MNEIKEYNEIIFENIILFFEFYKKLFNFLKIFVIM